MKKRNTQRHAVRSLEDVSLPLIASIVGSLLVIAAAFLPWSYPKPDQNWLERLFSLDAEVGPRLSGFDFGFGQSAAFTAGVAAIVVVVLATTGLAPRTLSYITGFFSLIAAYHVMNALREVATGELWWIEDGDLRSQPAAEATWDTFVALSQNGYGLLLAAVASLVALGSAVELILVVAGTGSVSKGGFAESDTIRWLMRVSLAFVCGLVWVAAWWWATLVFAAASLAIWVVAGRSLADMNLRSAVHPLVAVIGILSALHSFVYR